MNVTKPYDRIEQLTFDAQIAVAIIGNPATGDFELIDLLSDWREHVAALVARGMYFCGVAGLVDGVPKTALEEPMGNAMIDAAAAAFLSHIESRLDSALIARVEQKALDGWLARLDQA